MENGGFAVTGIREIVRSHSLIQEFGGFLLYYGGS
jgi:hypothetical protein